MFLGRNHCVQHNRHAVPGGVDAGRGRLLQIDQLVANIDAPGGPGQRRLHKSVGKDGIPSNDELSVMALEEVVDHDLPSRARLHRGVGRGHTIGPGQSPAQTHRLGASPCAACARCSMTWPRLPRTAWCVVGQCRAFDLITRPTALQRRAFKLLGVRLERTQ